VEVCCQPVFVGHEERKSPLNPYSCIALIISIIVHGLLIADFLAAPSAAASSASQHKGAYLTQVSILLQPAPVVMQPAIQSPAMRPKYSQKPTASPAPSEQEAVPAAPEIKQKPAPASSAPIETAPVGSQFVSPFSPIISQPLGRGSWGSSKPPAPGIDPTQLQRQQAQLQLRNMLMDRMGNWLGWQTQQHTEVSCLIRLDLTTRQASLSCIPAEKEAEIWSVLNGLLVAGPANGDGILCLQIGTMGTAQLSMANCELTP
jgi:hypothetical protein